MTITQQLLDLQIKIKPRHVWDTLPKACLDIGLGFGESHMGDNGGKWLINFTNTFLHRRSVFWDKKQQS